MKVYQAILLAIVGIVLYGISLAFAPQYNVYRMKMEGEAKLAESQASRQVLVSEAMAKKEAATLLGEAELIKAQYQAQAASEISASLSDGYLKYLWINEQGDAGSTIVYIPSNNLGVPEFSLPITEAPRLSNKPTP